MNGKKKYFASSIKALFTGNITLWDTVGLKMLGYFEELMSINLFYFIRRISHYLKNTVNFAMKTLIYLLFVNKIAYMYDKKYQID